MTRFRGVSAGLAAAALAALGLSASGEARRAEVTLVVQIDWEMTPRFGLDVNANGLPDLPNTHSYVNAGAQVGAEPRFEVTLEVVVAEPGSTRRFVTIDSAAWTVRAANCAPSALRPCESATGSGSRPRMLLREGAYDATVSFSGHTTQGRPLGGKATGRITVDDFLVVSIGDSYTSGEGNPERIRRSSSDGIVSLEVHWADSGRTGEKSATKMRAFPRLTGVSGRPPGGYCARDLTRTRTTCFEQLATSNVGRDHARAHRSTLAASAQAALALERLDTRTSVTFVSVAASGATVSTGLTGRYAGVENEPGAKLARAWADKMPAQVDQVAALVDRRKIDALTISIGGNDIGFGNVAQALILAGGADPRAAFHRLTEFSEYAAILAAVRSGDWNRVDAWPGLLGVGSYDNVYGGGFDGLPGLYDKLAGAIRQKLGTVPIRIGGVYLTEYPDPTKWLSSAGKRHYCNKMLGGVAIGGRLGHIDKEEARWAYEYVLAPLNRYAANAAARHRWRYVGGIAGAFGAGHGLCANPPYDAAGYDGNPYPAEVQRPSSQHIRWYRNARESELIQGPPGDRAGSKGTLHPSELGHHAIKDRLLSAIAFAPPAAPPAVTIVVP